MDTRTQTCTPTGNDNEPARCFIAIELSKKSWIVAVLTPLTDNSVPAFQVRTSCPTGVASGFLQAVSVASGRNKLRVFNMVAGITTFESKRFFEPRNWLTRS